ncbi:MAG: hypothetical protein MCSN_1360 [Candidatus Microsyncoccus archaeolyticus]|nr:MAG: hypothetical protein MCSN_1360 [Candidatus Parcubacteria bacterium]
MKKEKLLVIIFAFIVSVLPVTIIFSILLCKIKSMISH